jgi:hypothetical protein
MIGHILKSCEIDALDELENNVACVAQIESCYIKCNLTEHITPKLFYPHEL